jgi:hypothetical protein
VKHLGRIRPHASALAGGHDEDRERRGHGVRRLPGPHPLTRPPRPARTNEPISGPRCR